MFTYTILAGSTDVSVVIRVIDSTDGTPETGVAFNTSGIDLEYRREGAASTDITEVTQTVNGAHTDGGFVHIGNGYCRLDLPDAAVAAGVSGVLVHGTFTGMVVIGCYVQLVAYNPADGVRLGLTALPNAAAEASGGLYTRGSGAGQIAQDANGRVNVNVAAISTDSTAADNAEAYFDGTGYAGTNNVVPTVTSVTNQVTANVTAISGDSGAADNLEAALDGTGGVTITANITGNIAGNVSGSVGSVTGNVGGNVVGSVGSVTTVSDKTGYRLSATGVDDVWDEAASGHTTAGSFGDKLRAHQAGVLKALVTTGSTTTSVVLDASTGIDGGAPSATNDFYNGRVIVFISGTLAGQATDITDYDGSSKALAVTALTGAPSNGDTAVIV